MNKPTVSVVIPAYNEAANIGLLLKRLLAQVEYNFKLLEIIVYSDGSSDETAEIVRRFGPPVKLIEGQERQGLAWVQNNLFFFARGEGLVLLNADILINESTFLGKMVTPIFEGGADLVSCALRPLPPQNFLEKALAVGMEIKTQAYGRYQQGINVFTCHGTARAFSRRLYQKLRFPFGIGEDAFSFFYCLNWGYRYQYLSRLEVFFRLPQSLTDHEKQNQRYFYSQKLMMKLFGNFARYYYIAPQNAFLLQLVASFFNQPLLTSYYFFILFFLAFKSLFIKVDEIPEEKWNIATSSKALLRGIK